MQIMACSLMMRLARGKVAYSIRMPSFIFILIFLFCGTLTKCAWHTHQSALDHIDTTNLMQLKNLKADSNRSHFGSRTILSPLKARALSETAMSTGAQGGLAYAAKKINAQFMRHKTNLDNIFNFNAMMLDHGILPPVLEEGDNSLNLSDANTIRIADKTYKIICQARFSTTSPNWREYLLLPYDKPEPPDLSLLPKTSEEQAVWRVNLGIGWEKGIDQANNISHQNLARLKRDYRGMMLYRKLLKEKIISPPFVARTELGITGNGNHLRVNDQVLRIVALPQLQSNSGRWKAIVIKQQT